MINILYKFVLLYSTFYVFAAVIMRQKMRYMSQMGINAKGTYSTYSCRRPRSEMFFFDYFSA